MAVSGAMLLLLGSAVGWTYSTLVSRVDELQRVQAIRGEDIAALKARVNNIELQSSVMIQQHRDIENVLNLRK